MSTNFQPVLSNPSNLPRNCTFVDPYDRHVFKILPGESLNNLIEKVNKRREEIKVPAVKTEDLAQLITNSLYIDCKSNERELYFTNKTFFPSMSAFVEFASVLALEFKIKDHVSIKQRFDRAQKFCLNSCPFHDTGGGIRRAVKVFVDWVVDITTTQTLEEVTKYPGEDRLGTCTACKSCLLVHKNKMSNTSLIAKLSLESLRKMFTTWGPNAFERCHILNEAYKSETNRAVLLKKLKKAFPHGETYQKQYVAGKIEKSKQ